MAEPKSPAAGGALLALATVAGALFGAILGQPTIGVIAGVAIGAALAVAIWLRDRSRAGG